MPKRSARQSLLVIAICAMTALMGVLSNSSALAHGAHSQGHHRSGMAGISAPATAFTDSVQLAHAVSHRKILSYGAEEQSAMVLVIATDIRCTTGDGHPSGAICCGNACHSSAVFLVESTHQSSPRPEKFQFQPAVPSWSEVRFGLKRPPRA